MASRRILRTRPALLLLLLVAASAPLGCVGRHHRELPPLVSTELTLTGASSALLEGRWRDVDWVVLAEVQPRRLSVRVPDGFWISDARVVDREVRFLLHGGGGEGEMALRLLDAETVVLLPAGSEPSFCGTCTPYMSRLSTLIRHRAPRAVPDGLAWFSDRVEERYEAGMDWLASVL